MCCFIMVYSIVVFKFKNIISLGTVLSGQITGVSTEGLQVRSLQIYQISVLNEVIKALLSANSIYTNLQNSNLIVMYKILLTGMNLNRGLSIYLFLALNSFFFSGAMSQEQIKIKKQTRNFKASRIYFPSDSFPLNMIITPQK